MNGTFIANQYISGSRQIRTTITFDNGAEWHLLPAPEVTMDGVETDCEVVQNSYYVQWSVLSVVFIALLFPSPSYVFNLLQSLRSVLS